MPICNIAFAITYYSNDELEMNQFPHVYQIRLESNQQVYLIGVQQESHGIIHIFRNQVHSLTTHPNPRATPTTSTTRHSWAASSAT